MISTIKTYLLAGLAITASVFFAMFKASQAARYKEKAIGLIEQKKAQQRAQTALEETQARHRREELEKDTTDSLNNHW